MNYSIYTIPKDAEDCALELALVYQLAGGNIDITDFYLAALLKNFKLGRKILVISKDHRAFPTSIYDRKETFIVENETDVQVFGFYSFNENKYQKVLDKIIVVK
ncbi:MAG: hypothetical protein M1142_03530 [Patescibacteria group bacterium]|nr:hypothetical protein [Patescibacteria group bacterium]